MSDITDKNYEFISINLHGVAHSINKRSLSTIYAAHKYLIDKIRKSEHPEGTIELMLPGFILEEYKYAIISFVSMLRILTDQCILLITNDTIDSIARFIDKVCKT